MMEYIGDKGVVTVDGNPLDPRHDKVKLGYGNFEWGTNEMGPAQLAFALLQNEYGDNHPVHYMEFKWYVVAGLPPTFRFTSEELRAWVDELLTVAEPPSVAEEPAYAGQSK